MVSATSDPYQLKMLVWVVHWMKMHSCNLTLSDSAAHAPSGGHSSGEAQVANFKFWLSSQVATCCSAPQHISANPDAIVFPAYMYVWSPVLALLGWAHSG